MSGELFCFRVIDELGFWNFISKYDPACGVYFGRHDKDGSAIYTGDTVEFTDYSCSVYGLSDPVEFKNTAEEKAAFRAKVASSGYTEGENTWLDPDLPENEDLRRKLQGE